MTRSQPSRNLGPLLILGFITLGLQGRALFRGFVSEDFVILRRLAESDIKDVVLAEVSGPWLGITFVDFFRPFSTIALKAEQLVWGAWSPGYLLTHAGLHLVNAILVHGIVARFVPQRSGDLSRRAVPLAAAAYFALYPFHPNTVLFVASFATLFATTASLIAIELYARSLENRPWAALGAGLAAAFALGSYEAAAALPGFLLAFDVLLPAQHRRGSRAFRAVVMRVAPFAGLTAVYLGGRFLILGTPTGGYRGVDLVSAVWPAWDALLLPFGQRWPAVVGTGVSLVLLGVTCRAVWSIAAPMWRGTREAEDDGWRALWLLGVIWAFLAQAPFGVGAVTVANGRYWYMAAAGGGMLLAASAAWLHEREWRGVLKVIPVIGIAGTVVILVWEGVMLRRIVALHVVASAQVQQLQAGLMAVDNSGSNAPFFVVDHPRFVRDAEWREVAQVFHWGLSDALQPPFIASEIRAYPVPERPPAHLAPLVDGFPPGAVQRWDGDAGVFHEVTMADRQPRIDGAQLLRNADGDVTGVRIARVPGAISYRLTLLARVHPAFPTVPARPDAAEIEIEIPAGFVESMRHLQDDDIYWWAEALDTSGVPVAATPVALLR